MAGMRRYTGWRGESRQTGHGGCQRAWQGGMSLAMAGLTRCLWGARIPPARVFVGDGSDGELPDRRPLLPSEGSLERLSRSKGRILLGGITQPQQHRVWITGG